MTKSPRKNVPGVGIELGAACMPSGNASDRATAPGLSSRKMLGSCRFHSIRDRATSHFQAYDFAIDFTASRCDVSEYEGVGLGSPLAACSVYKDRTRSVHTVNIFSSVSSYQTTMRTISCVANIKYKSRKY